MIKQSSNLIGWEHILVSKLRLCVINWGRNTLAYLEFNWSFIVNIWRGNWLVIIKSYVKVNCKERNNSNNTSRQTKLIPWKVQTSLGIAGHTWPHATHSKSYLAMLSVCKICKTMNISFHRHWWTKNPTISYDEGTF